MSELKKCPFCGAPVRIVRNAVLEPEGVYCTKCHMIVKYTNIEPNKGVTFGDIERKIAEAWNRRTHETDEYEVYG